MQASLPSTTLQKIHQKVLISCWIFITVFCPLVHSPQCQPRNLPHGVSIVGPCSFNSPNSCKAACKQNGVMKWMTQVHCLKQGKWSHLPLCHDVLHRRSLEPVDCSKLPVNLRGKAFCVKVKLSKQGRKCPELLHMKMDLTDCPREANSHCIISCGTSVTNITCLPNGQWSHMPICKSSRENVCSDPELGTLVNCSRREGEECKVRCPGGNLMKGEVVCLSSGDWALVNDSRIQTSKSDSKWKIISKCSCISPNLSNEFEKVENCDNKKIGEKCHLKCKPEYSMIGKKTIICLKNASWSELPLCSNKTCPSPELPYSLQLKENCSSKLSGQSCELECQGKLQIIQKKPFRCVNGTQWTKFPDCACFPPELPEGMTTKENCRKRKIGSTCQLACEKNYSMSGSKIITCQLDGNWTTLPECLKSYCPKPKLPSHLIFSEDCQFKKTRETCGIECLNSQEKYEISCLNSTRWSPFPKCSCPIPAFSQSIELKEDCSAKKPGEKCKVSCKAMPELKKHVTCKNNSQWSVEPSCKKIMCPLPVLPNYLLFDEDCTNKAVEDRCKLICKMGGQFVKERSIKCLKGKRWSHFPICTCPTPYMREDLIAPNNCSSKIPGEKCTVRCKEVSQMDEQFILCKNDTTWTSQPSCSREFSRHRRKHWNQILNAS